MKIKFRLKSFFCRKCPLTCLHVTCCYPGQKFPPDCLTSIVDALVNIRKVRVLFWAHYKMVYQIVAPNKTLKLNPIKRCFDKIFYFTEWILLWIRDTDKHAFDQHQPRSSFLLNICPNSLDINSPNASSSVSRQEWQFLPLPANQSQVLETDDQ